ncbi:MAG: phosphoribosylformylglycinamidine cyclo-ligase [Candidatus Poribacteria bacterium]|nr:phosphoribosylformylglycinamidine cyclo-ligase [Candidatus Poribacteria bacterium]
MTKQRLTYADAGVSFEAKAEAFNRLKTLCRSTYRPEVLSEIGSFGGLFALAEFDKPVLVSSTDSVGTKLKIAFMMDVHDTVGYDIVAHCANDILVQGAEPLFFLDYIGTGTLRPAVVEQVVKGIAKGCRETGCALIGGETAELPDFYADGEYDLVGTIVGVVERSKLITGSEIQPGDCLIGLKSLGLHTNGFSLARHILFNVCRFDLDQYMPELGVTLGEELLKHHKSYVKPVLNLQKRWNVKGIAHITGGGLSDNITRILPTNCRVEIRKGSWEIPPIFSFLQECGKVEETEMYHVFNMGIGLVLVIPLEQVDAALDALKDMSASPFLIGKILHGEKEVHIV